MNRIEYADRVADMFKRSRAVSGKSQEYVAKALGVSKKTIQNWEAGLASPNIVTCLEWFDVLGVPIFPYIINVLSGGMADAGEHKEKVDEKLQEALALLSPSAKEKLLYLFCGSHGSSPRGVIEMITAYLKTPLAMRLNIAFSVVTNYDICKASNMIKEPLPEPNATLLLKSAEAGRTAVLNGKGSYTLLK